MKTPGAYLIAAFIIAFSVLVFIPLWAAYGVLIPDEGGHHGGAMVNPQEFKAKALEFAEKYKLPDGSVEPPPGSEVYLMAMQYAWIPNTIRLQTGEEYVFHISSFDVMHGFSLQMGGGGYDIAARMAPVAAFSFQMGGGSYNVVIMPKQATRIEMRPTQPGTYLVACNEYCGLGHEYMKFKIIVEGEPVSGQEPEHGPAEHKD